MSSFSGNNCFNLISMLWSRNQSWCASHLTLLINWSMLSIVLLKDNLFQASCHTSSVCPNTQKRWQNIIMSSSQSAGIVASLYQSRVSPFRQRQNFIVLSAAGTCALSMLSKAFCLNIYGSSVGQPLKTGRMGRRLCWIFCIKALVRA